MLADILVNITASHLGLEMVRRTNSEEDVVSVAEKNYVGVVLLGIEGGALLYD